MTRTAKPSIDNLISDLENSAYNAGYEADRGGNEDEVKRQRKARRTLVRALAALPPPREAGPVAGDLVSREAVIVTLRGIRFEPEDSRAQLVNNVLGQLEFEIRTLPAESQWRFDMGAVPKDQESKPLALACHRELFPRFGAWEPKYSAWLDWNTGDVLAPYAWLQLEVPPTPLSVEEGTKG